MTQLTQYTPKQKTAVINIFKNCQNYIEELITIQAKLYQTSIELSKNPEILDKILNLYRVKDMCYAYLIDPNSRHIGTYLQKLSNNEINKFIQNVDPVTIIDFFNQDKCLEYFKIANEMQNKRNLFTSDPNFKKDYYNFIKQWI